MERTIDATFDGEVFRPDEPVELKPNTKAKIIIEESKKIELLEVDKKKTGKPYAWVDYALSLELDLPADLATNLDDYLYGGKSLDNE